MPENRSPMLSVLDDSQRRVLDAPYEARRMVVAGPGSGKTSTSIALIERISNSEAVAGDPDASILYVSFSRAAIQAAVDAFGGELTGLEISVAAMTLDSLAWQLTGAGSEVNWPSDRDFDRIVRQAEAQLRSEYVGELDDVVHLIVDEAQDLSLDRRNLLCAIIDQLPGDAGITVFGDPLQAIYEFLDESRTEGRSAWAELEAELRTRGIGEMLTLNGSYRARRRGPKKVMATARELRTLSEVERLERLDDLASDLTHLQVEEFAVMASDWSGKTAVLSRTNAESLRLFHELSSSGLNCSMRQQRRSRAVVASWIAKLWAASGGAPVTMAGFSDFSNRHEDVDPGWFRLLLHASNAGSEISWHAIARLCGSAFEPTQPWFDRRTDGVVVSTIHQSKGLEWDNVAVVDARGLLRPVGRRQPESELLFVGLTRARDKVVIVDWEAPFTKSLRGSGLTYRPHPAYDKPIEVAITPGALRSDARFGDDVGQEALMQADPVAQINFELLASGRADWPTYRCLLDDVAVGVTTKEFGRSFASLYRTRPSAGWPNLGSVAIEGIESRWSVEDGVQFWLKPRPFGFAQVVDQGSVQ